VFPFQLLRVPALHQPPEFIEYLGKHNIVTFPADLDGSTSPPILRWE